MAGTADHLETSHPGEAVLAVAVASADLAAAVLAVEAQEEAGDRKPMFKIHPLKLITQPHAEKLF